MAIQNSVTLIGTINEILNDDKTEFKVKVWKRRKFPNFVFPTVHLSKELEYLKDSIAPGKNIVIQGTLTTEYISTETTCPNCNEVISFNVAYTFVSATSAYIVSNDAPNENNNMYLNKTTILGTLCNEVSFRHIVGTNSPVAKSEYTIASKRKAGGTDFTTINSYCIQAEEDKNRLKKSSQVLVNGYLVTMNKIKLNHCNSCSTEHPISIPITFLQSKNVEYLNNCIF